jgi:NADPH-dependent F420 reductase
MRIAVIGSGGIGSALAHLFARHGHEVIIGSRFPEAAEPLAKAIGASGLTDYRTAARAADLLCFCIPWEHAASAIPQLGDLSGKILLDPSNPEAADGRSLALGHSTSGAEILAGLARGARVVKAFNYLYAELLRDEPALARVSPSIFLCGDDASAKATVSQVVTSCGLTPVDCGSLKQARYLEPLAFLMVHLVREQGFAPDAVGMRFVRSNPATFGGAVAAE